MALPRPPLELIEDLVAEILLHLPLDDPACLVRASLFCKPWRRLLADRDFLRRYRAFHGAPPLLGFFHNHEAIGSWQFPRFVPTTAGSPVPQPASDFWSHAWAMDCRHGRVLLHSHQYIPSSRLVVWDPFTGDRQELPSLDVEYIYNHSAAVLCAVRGCDRVDCHGGPFRVVSAGCDPTGDVILACSYSSETDVWSMPASVDPNICNDGWLEFGGVIGDEIYLTLGMKILRYDLGKNCLSMMIQVPDIYYGSKVLMLMEDDSLGLAALRRSSLHLCSMKVNPEGVEEWVQYRVIELQKLIPIIDEPDGEGLVGFAEGVSIIFVSNGVATFAVELKSGRVRKVDDRGDYCTAFPYMRFYTPDHARSSCQQELADL